jgi:hypothetical protein
VFLNLTMSIPNFKLEEDAKLTHSLLLVPIFPLSNTVDAIQETQFWW